MDPCNTIDVPKSGGADFHPGLHFLGPQITSILFQLRQNRSSEGHGGS